MKNKLIILRGLPGSGKSTFAKQLVDRFGYKRFNKDDLRDMLDNGFYSRKNEGYITEMMYLMISMALRKGLDVIVDNTNFHPFQVKKCQELAERHEAECIIHDFDVPLEVCIERDLQRTKGRVGKEAIQKIYDKWFVDGKYPKINNSSDSGQ